MIGKSLGHYRIEAELGAGGMGVVYRAHDVLLERPVALKMVSEKMAADPAGRAGLLREARTASALNHPNICHIYEVGETEGRGFIAMELVQGQSLQERIGPQGLPAESALHLAVQIADALAHAHDRGVVHRDLKPRNVAVTPEGRAKVLDFGLARRMESTQLAEVTRSRDSLDDQKSIAGTLSYMAPEVLCGEPGDSRSDIWAFGVLLCEMLSGSLPFQGKTGFELSSAILREPPALPAHVPAALRAIVGRCLAKEPAQRFQRGSEVRAALEALSESSRATTGPVSGKAQASRPRAAWLAVAGAALLVGGFAWYRFAVGPAAPGSSSAPPIRSLAVLPLKPLNPASEDQTLGLGLADAIIMKVSQTGGLIVRPMSAVRKYSGQEVDALAAGREMKIESVLDGTLQRSGDRVRVNVNLLRVGDGVSLWSETFDVQVKDIFAVQDEVSQQVASRLRLTLSPAQQASLTKRYTQSPEAFEYYTKGMQQFDRRGFGAAQREPVQLAIRFLQRAVELDPNYALARAQLAYGYTWMGLFHDVQNPVWFTRARDELGRAEALDPALAEIHIVRGELDWSPQGGFKIEEAVAEFQEAQQTNPGVAHSQLGIIYAHMGLEEAALRQLNRAFEIDPSSELNKLRIVEGYDLLVRPDESIAARDRFGNLFGLPTYLRKSYLWKNRLDQAEALLAREEVSGSSDPFDQSTRMLISAIQGRPPSGTAWADDIARNAVESRAYHHLTYNIACIFALQKQAAPAVKWLQITVDRGMPSYTLFSRDPHLDAIRKEPRFVELMEKLGAQNEAWLRKYK